MARFSLCLLILLSILGPVATMLQHSVRNPTHQEGFTVPLRTAYTARIAADDPTDASLKSLALGGTNAPPQLFVACADDPLAALLALRMCAPPADAGLLLIDPRRPLSEHQMETIAELHREGSRLTGVGELPRKTVEQLSGYLNDAEFAASGPELAVAVDAHLQRTGSTPERVLIVPSEDMDFALPAATWVARTGDAVFPVDRDAVCPTVGDRLRDRQEHLSPDATQNLYLLGPSTTASSAALEELGQYGQAVRVAAPDPETAALALARFHDDGTQMGWDWNGPRQTDCTYFVGNPARSGELLASAQLSADGPSGPILLTRDDALSPQNETFLRALHTTPGHGSRHFTWIAGDAQAVSGSLQVDLDRINSAASESTRQMAAAGVLSGAWLLTAFIAGIWVWIHSSARRPEMNPSVRLLWVLCTLVLGLIGVLAYYIAQRGELPQVTTSQQTGSTTRAITMACKSAGILTAFAVLTSLLWPALGRQLWILPSPFTLLGLPETRSFMAAYLLALALGLLAVEPALLPKKRETPQSRLQRLLPGTIISLTAVAVVYGAALRWIRWELLPTPPVPTEVLWYGTASLSALLAMAITYPLHYWLATGSLQVGTLE